MTDHQFTAVFMNKEGTARNNQGLSVNEDKWNQLKSVTINLESVESYFEADNKSFGHTCCNVRTKTGDEWLLTITYDELRALKNSLAWIKQN